MIWKIIFFVKQAYINEISENRQHSQANENRRFIIVTVASLCKCKEKWNLILTFFPLFSPLSLPSLLLALSTSRHNVERHVALLDAWKSPQADSHSAHTNGTTQPAQRRDRGATATTANGLAENRWHWLWDKDDRGSKISERSRQWNEWTCS